MPPLLASVIYLSAAFYLLRRDMRQQRPNVTPALWLPTIWVFISGTRFVSQWLDMFGINLGGTSYEEGSPIDALFFGGMTLLGIRVLLSRRITPAEFARYNPWVAFYLVFCLVACFWSDFSFVAMKRWTKLLGQVVMVVVVITEPNPQWSMVTMFKRLAYLVVPASFLFIKYYPEWGRGFDQWTGEGGNTGITLNKNTLGSDCMIIGVVLFWELLRLWSDRGKKFWKGELPLVAALVGFNWYLLVMAQSSTSMFCLVLAMMMMIVFRLKFLNPQMILYCLLGGVAILIIAEFGFHFITFFVTQVLHRNMTFTDRTLIWSVLLDMKINPVLGTGYESFFLGERREEIWAKFPVLQLISAHNGYLQTYLDMGLLGLAVTLGLVFSILNKARRELLFDRHLGSFRLSYLLIFLLYNWTEVGFRMQFAPFFVFFLAALEQKKTAPLDNPAQPDWPLTENYNEG